MRLTRVRRRPVVAISPTAEPAAAAPEAVSAPAPPAVEPAAAPTAPASLFDRLRTGLSRTQGQLVGRLDGLLRGRKAVDAALLEDLEELLVTSDLGVSTTQRLIQALEARLSRGALNNGDQVRQALKDEMLLLLSAPVTEPQVAPGTPMVLLMTGVNGVGKTTTIGKLAHHLVGQGKKVLLGAGDTFRAAADQLGVWAERSGCELIRHAEGADPGAVAFDAVKAAVARKVDVLLLDTAGRLHTKINLMEELKKVRRILARELPGAPHQTLLVLDATTGQNALTQARMFSETIGLDGLVLTKLDGTAKGGIVIAIAAELGLPVRYIGVGEQMDDLRPFDARDFVEALFATTEG
jgi:fused signal recognition particle receptor